MTICIFGAEGRSGVEVVKQALSRGHQVTAFVYDKKSLAYIPDGAKVYLGNILNYNEVLNAIDRVDAVISVVGHVKNSDPRMQTKGIRNIILAMKEKGVRRVVSLTGTGVRQPGDKPSMADYLANFAIKIIDPERIRDGIEHAEALGRSGLNWTILRVLKLSNSAWSPTDFRLTTGGPAENITPRQKAACILVSLASSNDFVGSMPIVSR